MNINNENTLKVKDFIKYLVLSNELSFNNIDDPEFPFTYIDLHAKFCQSLAKELHNRNHPHIKCNSCSQFLSKGYLRKLEIEQLWDSLTAEEMFEDVDIVIPGIINNLIEQLEKKLSDSSENCEQHIVAYPIFKAYEDPSRYYALVLETTVYFIQEPESKEETYRY